MAEAQQDLAQAMSERNVLVSEKDEAVRQVVALDNQVQVLRQELLEARQTGTPIGEGESLLCLARMACGAHACYIASWTSGRTWALMCGRRSCTHAINMALN